MKIGISGFSIHGTGKRGGFWEYFKTLIKILSKKIENEEVFVFIPKGILEELDKINNKNFNFIEINTFKKGTQYFECFILPFYLKKYKINVLHFPNFASPLFLNIPYVITVHDLAFLKFKEGFKRHDLFYWRNIFRLAVKKASLIIAVSENTKKDLNFFWNIPLNKIKVLPSFSSLIYEDVKEIKEKYNLKYPYFLFVGTLEPRKNLERTIEAFLSFSKKIEENVKLILIGQRGWKCERILRKIEENKGKIIWFNNISKKELPFFYKNAIALLYPSLYEGFGLPIIEAYKFNLPVITSNVSSLPEVAGKGAILVNPYDIKEIESAILKIYLDKDLKSKIVEYQKEEIKKYDYERIGEEILSLYRSLVKI
ncbi:MAG: glycosyltransferase family 1 protein [candidate division WOR-3 bacterium]